MIDEKLTGDEIGLITRILFEMDMIVLSKKFHRIATAKEQPNNRQIWIVQGTTGEYSDRKEWIVCAMYDETAAKELSVTLSELGKEAFKLRCNGNYEWENEPAGKRLLAADQQASIDYTGIDYTAYSVKIAHIEGGLPDGN
jgi:hypothetical protein